MRADGQTDMTEVIGANLMKICAMVAELFHEGGRTDGQTDMTEVIGALRSFTNAPINSNIKKAFIQLWT